MALAAERIVEYVALTLVSKSNTSIWTPIRQDSTTLIDFSEVFSTFVIIYLPFIGFTLSFDKYQLKRNLLIFNSLSASDKELYAFSVSVVKSKTEIETLLGWALDIFSIVVLLCIYPNLEGVTLDFLTILYSGLIESI